MTVILQALMSVSRHVTRPLAHVALRQLTVDEFKANTVGHRQQVFRLVMGVFDDRGHKNPCGIGIYLGFYPALRSKVFRGPALVDSRAESRATDVLHGLVPEVR